MTIQKSYNYQLKNNLRGIAIYYMVVVLVFAFFITTTTVAISDQGNMHINVSSGSIELITIIFIFVLGLNSFKENFFMLLQNGQSRLSLFKGGAATLLTLSAGMALIDTALGLALKAVGQFIDHHTSISMIEMLYGIRGPISLFYQVLFCFGTYALMSFFGYFLTVMYYRLSKGGKVAISVGVPVLLIALPTADIRLFGGAVADFISAALRTMSGLEAGQPLIGVASSLALVVVLGALTWLMMRKAPVKK